MPAPSHHPARDRDLRRLRILAQVQAGESYASIGRAEGLSRERVRQIVAQALSAGESETRIDHARLQIARLEPALRLAAGAVAEGDLAAIDRLLRVLDRLDKYSAVEGAEAKPNEGGRTRLLAKLDAMAQRMIRAREREQAATTDEAPQTVEADDGLDASEDIDGAENPSPASSAALDEV
ncbi:MAG: hypothetical protein E7774_04370 [Bradyrhizobium sp.]|nr:MAG: hypothetical protein E7774_04370 [Bradyrhizobium sp.]